MEKTKFGLSTSLAAVLLFVLAYFSGYVAVVVFAGYILLFEESGWLKKMAVKCLVIMACFSVLSLAINYLPDLLYSLTSGADYSSGLYKFHSGLSKVTTYIGQIIKALHIVVYTIMVVCAFGHKDVRIPLVDNILDKHFEL